MAARIPVEVKKLDHTRVTCVEVDFHESFAEWLVEVAEEVNAAVASDGSILCGKWRTPDRISVLRPRIDAVARSWLIRIKQ